MKKWILSAAAGMLIGACGGEPEDPQYGPYEGGASLAYEYDALGRLVIFTVDNTIHTKYCLDGAGNRQRVSLGETGCPN